MATGSRVDEGFRGGVVRMRCRRRSNEFFEDRVEMVGELVTPWVDVDGGL